MFLDYCKYARGSDPLSITGNAGYRLDKWIMGLAKLLLAGCLLITASLTWDLFFPINKKLFKQKVGWTRFFAVFGKNPLFIYILSELLFIVLNSIRLSSGQSLFHGINTGFFQAIAPGVLDRCLFALVYMLVCWGLVNGWKPVRSMSGYRGYGQPSGAVSVLWKQLA